MTMSENSSPGEPIVEIDYGLGVDEDPDTYPTLDDKFGQAIDVTRTALEHYSNPAVLWTGGKDSTLVLYIVNEVAEESDIDVPPAVFIDHFQHFDVVYDFVERWADIWNIDLIYARNSAVGSLADDPGDEIQVSDLNERNQREVREKLEYEEDSFPFLLDTLVGNHLLKTVALNDAIEDHDFDGIITGVRWDEQAARSDETFFSPRQEVEKYPPHDRVHPILQFKERDVWDATWQYIVPDNVESLSAGFIPQSTDDLPSDVEPESIPINPKYFAGYRSLGSEVSTRRSDDRPAWVQDLDGTVEREGRAQDKEGLMERLRDLGYM